MPPPSPAPPVYTRALAAGYKAAMLCSGIFIAGRSEAQIERDELRGIYAEYNAIVPNLPARVERVAHQVDVGFDAKMPPRRARWNGATGCTLDPIGLTTPVITPPPAVAATAGPLPADPRPWPMGDAGIAPRPSPALANVVAQAFDRATFGARSETVGVVVVRDGRVVAERYREGYGPFVANRTWSVAKSIAGTLIGLAGMNPMQPATIPEWRAGLLPDPRNAIRLDDLMRMASGLHSDTAGNRTDAVYFGGTSAVEGTVHWPIEAPRGTRFRYANNDILLAVRAMRQTFGEARYRSFPRTALFTPLGMRHTFAQTDWRGNYIMSSDVWTTARDLARLGQFWLQDGVWQGRRMLPAGWMRYMTTPAGPQPIEREGYGATIWLFGPNQGLPAGSYAAQGNRGQYVMVVPTHRLVIVRRGEDGGGARFDIARFAAEVVKTLS